MNKIRTAHSLLPFFVLLAQLSVSIPVFAVTPTDHDSVDECKNNCNNSPVCDKVSDLWTRVKEMITCCECTKSSAQHCSQTDCSNVDESKHDWVLTKESETNYTLVAGQRIAGIECEKIRDNTAPDYWQFAWKAAQEHLSKYKERIGLAINSQTKRGANQLHIHVSCIQNDVKTKLAKAETDHKIPTDATKWRDSLGVVHPGYYVLHQANLPRNLFQLLHDNFSAADMANQTLVVTVAPGGEFYILKSSEGGAGGGTGHGEDLLDESCRP